MMMERRFFFLCFDNPNISHIETHFTCPHVERLLQLLHLMHNQQKAEADSHIQLAAFNAQSASRRYSSKTFIPSSHEIHKSPRVKKHATACRAR
uniref:CSON011540 protein n=1 Tax=Culicoides sonorensis TaxID=179676 RepID=A0A336M7K7_CULSO